MCYSRILYEWLSVGRLLMEVELNTRKYNNGSFPWKTMRLNAPTQYIIIFSFLTLQIRSGEYTVNPLLSGFSTLSRGSQCSLQSPFRRWSGVQWKKIRSEVTRNNKSITGITKQKIRFYPFYFSGLFFHYKHDRKLRTRQRKGVEVDPFLLIEVEVILRHH